MIIVYFFFFAHNNIFAHNNYCLDMLNTVQIYYFSFFSSEQCLLSNIVQYININSLIDNSYNIV